MTDRTKLPPGVETQHYSHPSGELWMYFMRDPSKGSIACAFGAWAETEEGCKAKAWAEYDALTRPARVEMLRNMVADIEARRGELYEACLDRGTPWDIAGELRDMANKLERSSC